MVRGVAVVVVTLGAAVVGGVVVRGVAVVVVTLRAAVVEVGGEVEPGVVWKSTW